MNLNENTTSKKFTIVFSDDVDTELQDIYDYISFNLFNEPATKKLMRKISESVKHLDTFPNMYPLSKFDGLRKINVDNYLIFYEVDENKKEVYILHACHGSRDYETLF